MNITGTKQESLHKRIILNLELNFESTRSATCITRIRGFYPQPENEPDDVALKSQTYANYIHIMLQQNRISQRLSAKTQSKVQRLGQMLYQQPQEESHKAAISASLEKLHVLPFRKMKFSSWLYHQKNDMKLVRRLKTKFGHDAVLIFGDWSAPNTKYQEPTRNKGLIRMLKKNGFTVYLINEKRLRLTAQSAKVNWRSSKKYKTLDHTKETSIQSCGAMDY